MRAEAQAHVDQINQAVALLRRFLDWDRALKRLEELNAKVEDQALWNDPKAAQEVMRDLGITYTHCTPKSLCDSWWFWNCENVPETLPAYLTVLNVKPRDAVGYGLSEEEADEIEQRK